MGFDEWLDAERGRLKMVAEHFHVSSSAVSQWRTNGVPVDNMIPLREFTGMEVSLEEMLDRRAAMANELPIPLQTAG